MRKYFSTKLQTKKMLHTCCRLPPLQDFNSVVSWASSVTNKKLFVELLLFKASISDELPSILPVHPLLLLHVSQTRTLPFPFSDTLHLVDHNAHAILLLLLWRMQSLIFLQSVSYLALGIEPLLPFFLYGHGTLVGDTKLDDEQFVFACYPTARFEPACLGSVSHLIMT